MFWALLWRNANVMLFPSKWEGLPGAVLRIGNVSGRAVLASDIPGVLE